MRVLIVDKRATRRDKHLVDYICAGAHVMGTGCLDVAEAYLSHTYVDMMIVDDWTLKEELSAFLETAEGLQPHIATFLQTYRMHSLMDEMSNQFASLHGFVAPDVPVETTLQLCQSQLTEDIVENVECHLKIVRLPTPIASKGTSPDLEPVVEDQLDECANFADDTDVIAHQTDKIPLHKSTLLYRMLSKRPSVPRESPNTTQRLEPALAASSGG